ncbi:MAG: hypothetical protein Q8P22_00965 [Chloroflexota bacterium]|nr:hypothetical protein [Chloroflexota bacterium]
MKVGWKQRAKRAPLVVAVLALLIIGGWVVWQLGQGGEQEAPIPSPGEERPLEQVTTRVFSADLAWSSPLAWKDAEDQATAESASLPADVAVVGGRVFVLDTSNGRILELAPDGSVARILDSRVDERMALKGAMAMTAYTGKLYVANSGAGTVVVVDPSGRVDQVITPQVEAAERAVRPVGIAITASGQFFLSDPDNNRVLKLDGNGQQIASIGTGKRDSGEYGLNAPGGLTLDSQGNLYVVDMLNYAVKKYSPDGQFLLSMGEAGDTEGTFSRPKAVAVDGQGNIYVSDGLLVAVEVFNPDGTYAGFIGRQDPADKESPPLFQAPHGLKIVGDKLYVIDRFAGLFQFQVGSAGSSS